MKRSLRLLALLLVLPLLCLNAPARAQAEDARGFDTAEACAQAVFDALKAADMAALDDCYAFAEIARQFDYIKYSERLHSIVVAVSLLPATGPLNIVYNEAKLRSDFYRRLGYCTLRLNRGDLGEFLDSGRSLPATDASYADVLRLLGEASTMDCWKNFSLIEIATPMYLPDLAEIYYSEVSQKNIVMQSAPWGFTETTDLLLILGPDGSEAKADAAQYVMPIQFFRSDGRWLASPIGSHAAMIMGISMTDMVAPLAP